MGKVYKMETEHIRGTLTPKRDCFIYSVIFFQILTVDLEDKTVVSLQVDNYCLREL